MAMFSPQLVNAFYVIRTVFNDPNTLDEARTKPNYFTRKRKLPFDVLLQFLISNHKSSQQNSLNDFTKMQRIYSLLLDTENPLLDEATLPDFPDPNSENYINDLTEYFNTVCNTIDALDIDLRPASQQALSKQRSHLNHSPFQKAFYALRDCYYSDFNLSKKLGYKLFAIDGTLVPLPNLPQFIEWYGTTGRGSSSPSARASLCFDSINNFVVEAELEPMAVDERTLARRHIEKISATMPLNDVMFIFDRGYPDQKLFRFIQSKNAKFLARVRSKYSCEIDDLPIDDTLGLGDHIVYLKSKNTNEEDLKIRVIKFELPSGEIEMLVTNEFDIPSNQFMDLYHDRWPIEIENDILKNKLEMSNFTGFSQNVICQDFWIAVLLSFVASIIKNECDQIIQDDREGNENKHKYQSNMCVIISSLKRYISLLIFHLDNQISAYCFYMLLQECKRSIVQQSEDEHNPRNNARDTSFHFNRKRC